MNTYLKWKLGCCMVLFVSMKSLAQTDLKQLKVLGLNEVEPTGWLKNQILRDVTHGYFSAIEELQPTLRHAVFGPQKVTNFAIDKNGDYTVRKTTWWWGEHEGFWADVIIRSAFLTGDMNLVRKADSIVNYVLSNQEKDGYIGIYQQGNRLNLLKGENGELWTQSRMLCALLAYYEFTGNRKVLDAVERAAQFTMSHYGPGKSYFQVPGNRGGGTSHGLMFVETMEMLYRLTGKKIYADFGLWLYKDYSTSTITINRDNQMSNLLNRELLFEEHGAHIAEHNRVVFWVASLLNDPQHRAAADNVFYKLNRSSVPSGALVSDEMVRQRHGDPGHYYEFCTMTERVISTFSGMQKWGKVSLADEIESIVFNAAQGARLADLSATSYCSRDNKIEAVPTDKNFRFQYSANNSPACCNLNAAKLYPYYVSNLWMKTADEKGFVATAYGPSKLTSTINGAKVTIEEITQYPFENSVRFLISTKSQRPFSVICRKPAWALKVQAVAPGAQVQEKEEYIVFTKKWESGDQINLTFESAVHPIQTVNGDTYLKYGALIYSLPIEERRDTVKTFKNRFYTFNIVPGNRPAAEKIFADYKLLVPAEGKSIQPVANPAANNDYPWDAPYRYLPVEFVVDGMVRKEKLWPMGSTILRKVTFPLSK